MARPSLETRVYRPVRWCQKINGLYIVASRRTRRLAVGGPSNGEHLGLRASEKPVRKLAHGGQKQPDTPCHHPRHRSAARSNGGRGPPRPTPRRRRSHRCNTSRAPRRKGSPGDGSRPRRYHRLRATPTPRSRVELATLMYRHESCGGSDKDMACSASGGRFGDGAGHRHDRGSETRIASPRDCWIW